MSGPSWEDVLAEARDGHVGPAVYRLTLDTARSMSRRYPAQIYSPDGVWSDDALRALAHECFARHLRPDQVEYLAHLVDDIHGARRFVAGRVKRTLIDIRRTDVVDNLLGRLRRRLEETPGIVCDRRYWHPCGSPAPMPMSGPLMAELVSAIAVIPRLRENPSVQAPKVFDDAGLTAVAEVLLNHRGNGTLVRDAEEILRRALTPLVVSALIPNDGSYEPPQQGPTPEEEVMVRETTDQIVRELGREELLLLRLVLEGWRDGAVAEHLGVSRPAVVQRRRRLGERLGTYLEPLEPALGERVSEELAHRLTHHG
ncbi:hypothetical protein [Streptomyces sp. H51]|uniref:hypothetical protein n=1 Tax=Streptomyces sp. H51 TaxID=3111770 RepID=UPI002D76AD6A|nr:hypothetical protein [Streptomyces sp. H51]